jgi:Flp pilus assembly protein TadG
MFPYLRLQLDRHLAKLRSAQREGDRGASAIELAIITAVLVILAVVVVTVISSLVHSQSSSITDNFNPNS